jgi:hypothetical protein
VKWSRTPSPPTANSLARSCPAIAGPAIVCRWLSRAWPGRADYPGVPTDVLDPAGFTDPAPAVVEEITTTRADPVEMDERIDARTDYWVDHGTDYPGLPPDSNDTVPLADLDF